jgi:hypothetical protein
VDDYKSRAEFVRAAMKARIPKGKRREVARELKISNTALGDFLDGRTGPPLEERLIRYEKWLEGLDRSDRPDSVTGIGFGLASDFERVWLEELRRIGESDASPEQKMLDRDSLASVIAGVAWARAEAAAHERARAVAKVSAAGEARAEALGRRAIPHGPPRPRPGADSEEEEVA